MLGFFSFCSGSFCVPINALHSEFFEILLYLSIYLYGARFPTADEVPVLPGKSVWGGDETPFTIRAVFLDLAAQNSGSSYEGLGLTSHASYAFSTRGGKSVLKAWSSPFGS